MNCTSVQQTLDAQREGRLEQTEAARIQAHLAACAGCRAFADDLARLRSTLAAPLPPVPASLRHHVRRSAGRSRAVGGMAAAMLLAVAVVMLRPVAEDPAYRALAEPVWAERTVRLALDSEQALAGVTFRLELPEGVELQGRPGQRALVWQDDLAAGANRLSIPLLLRDQAAGELVARIEYDGRSRELRVSL